MGLFDKFKPGSVGGRHKVGSSGRDLQLVASSETAAGLPTRVSPPEAVRQDEPSAGYAVLDVETTGLSPSEDRIVELAVVRTDQYGSPIDEWTTRFNPERSVGASHIHGLTATDLKNAPLFRDTIPYLNWLLAGRALVAHNASFDLSFLRSEYERAGWQLPITPTVCTLAASKAYLPQLERRRLPDCCWAVGVQLEDVHSALGDARAVANLVRAFIAFGGSSQPLSGTRLVNEATTISWPTRADAEVPLAVPHRSFRPRTEAAPTKPLTNLVQSFKLPAALHEGAPEGSLAYLELLAQALEDGLLSGQEWQALGELASHYEMSDDDVMAANRAFLLGLAAEAAEDGRVAREERAELRSVAALLDLPNSIVQNVLNEADAARSAHLGASLPPLPENWSLGEPLHVGERVVLTGPCAGIRDRLEQKAVAKNMRVSSSVSRKTAMLVTDGSFVGTKADKAVEVGSRIVTPAEFDILLDHVQPAATGEKPKASSTQSVKPRAVLVVTHEFTNEPSPTAVRAWALQNGFQVGVRGRVAKEVIQAFKAANRPPPGE